MKKEQELLDLSYKESVRQKRERKKKEKEKKKKKGGWESFMPFYLQWYCTYNWLHEKTKAWYQCPRCDWMFLDRSEKNQITKEKKRKKKK